MLVEVRTLVPHYAQDQIAKLPSEIRDQLEATGKIESRLRRLSDIDATVVSTMAGAYRLSWLIPLIDQDRDARRQVRQLERDLVVVLDEHGTTLRDEPGMGPIAAATLLAEVGDPFRFARESKFARWCATERSRGRRAKGGCAGEASTRLWREPSNQQRALHRQRHPARDTHEARVFIDRRITEGKTRREAQRAHSATLANRVIRRMWTDEQQRLTGSLQPAA